MAFTIIASGLKWVPTRFFYYRFSGQHCLIKLNRVTWSLELEPVKHYLCIIDMMHNTVISISTQKVLREGTIAVSSTWTPIRTPIWTPIWTPGLKVWPLNLTVFPLDMYIFQQCNPKINFWVILCTVLPF
mgnify:CR=1 FL=1